MNRVSRVLSMLRSFFGAFEKSRRLHLFRPRRERRRRPAPAQRLNVREERRVAAQRRELLEEQRELALFAQNFRRKIFDGTVQVQQLRGSPGPNSWNARVTIC